MSEEQELPQGEKPVEPIKSDQTPPFNQAPLTPPPFQQPPPFSNYGYGGQQNLPNSTPALVMGILAIPACCFYGIFGLIFGIIAWVLGAGDVKKYHLNPGVYTEASYKNAKAGKICGMIATILSALFIVFFVLIIVGIVSNPHMLEGFFKNLK